MEDARENGPCLGINPYVNEALLRTEYVMITRDPQVADLHLRD